MLTALHDTRHKIGIYAYLNIINSFVYLYKCPNYKIQWMDGYMNSYMKSYMNSYILYE